MPTNQGINKDIIKLIIVIFENLDKSSCTRPYIPVDIKKDAFSEYFKLFTPTN